MRRFLIALQFLTILPVRISAKGGFASGEKTTIKREDFGASLLYFPIIGLLIGILLAISAFVFSFLPGLVRGAFILIISSIITGGIHLDGFADTCDGFYGNRPKEKILEIMRDSRIGVMGAIGVFSILLLKFAIIASLSDAVLWKALIEMAVFARWSQALACSTSCYARSEGKAEYFIGHTRKKDIFIGGIFTLGLFLWLMQMKGLFLFFLSMLPVFLFLRYIRKKIGGMTGDTIGAVSEIAEVSTLFFILILGSVWI
jgi:adenosylcobinamide-GDP ribazoletransferase